MPGVDGQELARQQQIEEAQKDLERAISEEAFERAAELRDRLSQLTESPASPREDDSASATS